MNRIPVKGIIMVISCQKHRHTRMVKYRLPKDEYSGWKVMYVLGDFLQNEPYTLQENILTIRCEDSYIHLLKKVSLGIKYLREIFDIEEGIIRMGDDLIVDEDLLHEFLVSQNKKDYMGYNPYGSDYFPTSKLDLCKKRNDYFMSHYYEMHPEDFMNPHHGLKGLQIHTYTLRPELVAYASGVFLYLSNHACDILINHMESVGYNIFSYDLFTESYPYTIEDCGIGFIMYMADIPFTYAEFYSNYVQGKNPTICIHTNEYR